MRKAHGASRKPILARSGSSCSRRKTLCGGSPGNDASRVCSKTHCCPLRIPKTTTAPEGEPGPRRRNRRYGRIGLVAAGRLRRTAGRFRLAASRFTGGLAAPVMVEQAVEEALDLVQMPRAAATRGRFAAGRLRRTAGGLRLATSRLGSTTGRFGRGAAARLGSTATVAVAQQAIQQPGFRLGSRTQHQADQHKSGQYETLGHGIHSCTRKTQTDHGDAQRALELHRLSFLCISPSFFFRPGACTALARIGKQAKQAARSRFGRLFRAGNGRPVTTFPVLRTAQLWLRRPVARYD